MSTDPYSDRVGRIFERINNIQNNADDERAGKFKWIENILSNFETNLNEISNAKLEKF